MKHYYEDIDGWFGFKPQYENMIKTLPDGAIWVEVGCWMGRSLVWLMVESQLQGKQFEVHAVDSWQGNPNESWYTKNADKLDGLFEKFQANLEPFKDQFKTHRCLSWDGAANFEDASVDYVLIDAGHDEESVSKDIAAWWPKVKPGGYMGGDDYVVNDWGVFPAVQAFIKKQGLELKIELNEGSNKSYSWLVRKPK
jgi:hypothetical protein